MAHSPPPSFPPLQSLSSSLATLSSPLASPSLFCSFIISVLPLTWCGFVIDPTMNVFGSFGSHAWWNTLRYLRKEEDIMVR